MEMKCDLILLSWNNPEILRQCVDSILRSTRTPSRLIMVDNGSSETGVREYLSSLKGNDTIQIRLIFNTVNEGFAKGMNKGMKASDAPYVCLRGRQYFRRYLRHFDRRLAESDDPNGLKSGQRKRVHADFQNATTNAHPAS